MLLKVATFGEILYIYIYVCMFFFSFHKLLIFTLATDLEKNIFFETLKFWECRFGDKKIRKLRQI